jgi:hypothetical protein
MTSYPEKIPNALDPVKSFRFNLTASKDVKAQLESQLSNLNDRIDKISDSFTLDDVPIIRYILTVSHNREELKKIGKALDRIADLIDAKDQLSSKLKVIETAEKDPNWFAWAFGDFSEDIEFDIDNLFNGDI